MEIDQVHAAVAAGMLASTGQQTAQLNVLGVTATLAFHLNSAEHQRRHAAGVAALPRLDLLDALLGLPQETSVPRSILTERERRLLNRLPPGWVERGAGALTRRATSPLRVDLAIVQGRQWRATLRRATRFAPMCRRAVLLERRRRDIDVIALEASFYGVGLLVSGEQGPYTVVEPRRSPATRAAVAWWFAESVYAQLNETTSVEFTPAAPPKPVAASSA